MPLSHSSQATRCTGSREKLYAALRECRRHVQGVPLRRARRFARQERCGEELAGSLGSGRLSPVASRPFFLSRRSLRGITDLPLSDDHRDSRGFCAKYCSSETPIFRHLIYDVNIVIERKHFISIERRQLAT